MSDLIKSITTTEISGNDVLKEVFDAAISNTPDNNDLLLSYNPSTRVIGKSAFPADALQSVQDLSSSKKTTSVNTDRVLTFTGDKTIPQFSASSNVSFTADYTGAQDNCTTTFKVLLTNGAVPVLPAEFEEYASSTGFINGVVNTIICFRIAGSYGYISTVLKKDLPNSNDGIGNTTLTSGTTTSDSVPLSWTEAEEATLYTLERFLSSDYSSNSAIIYEGSLLSFTDRGLSPTTTYYYQITPKTEVSSGLPSRTSATTAVFVPETVPDVIDNNYVAANRLQGTMGYSPVFQNEPSWGPERAQDLNFDTVFITYRTGEFNNQYAGYWGLDLGVSKVVKTIANVMRPGETEFNSFVFQGSNTSFTEDQVDLLTVSYPQNDTYVKDWVVRRLNNTTAYRFYRFRMLVDAPFATAEYAIFDK